MEVIYSGYKHFKKKHIKLNTTLQQKKIIAFEYQKQDILILYNDNEIKLYKKEKSCNNFIECIIPEMNWSKDHTNLNNNIYNPLMKFEQNILFCLCTNINSKFLLFIKNLNIENGLCIPWEIKILNNWLNDTVYIDVSNISLCINEINKKEISFIGIYNNGIHHEIYKIYPNNKTNKLDFESVCNKNILNNEDNTWPATEEGQLINIKSLNAYLYLPGESKTIYKIHKDFTQKNKIQINQLIFPKLPRCLSINNKYYNHINFENIYTNNNIIKQNKIKNNNNSLYIINNYKKKKKNTKIELWNKYQKNLYKYSEQINTQIINSNCYKRSANKQNTQIIYFETTCGIIFAEIDLALWNIIFFTENDNKIIFHSYFKCNNNNSIDYVWKNNNELKLIYYKKEYNEQLSFIQSIDIYDLIPMNLLYKIQKKQFILVKQLLKQYLFPLELIELLYKFMNPLL